MTRLSPLGCMPSFIIAITTTYIWAPSAAATLHSGHVDTSRPWAIKLNRFGFRLHDGRRLRAVQPGVHFRPAWSFTLWDRRRAHISPTSPQHPVQPGASKSGATVLHSSAEPVMAATFSPFPPSPHTLHQGTCRTSHDAAGGMDRGDLAQVTQWPMTSPEASPWTACRPPRPLFSQPSRGNRRYQRGQFPGRYALTGHICMSSCGACSGLVTNWLGVWDPA